MLYIALPCAKCGRDFPHPGEVPPPDGVAFCPRCAKRIEETIAQNLARWTGSPVGGITMIDGKAVARHG